MKELHPELERALRDWRYSLVGLRNGSGPLTFVEDDRHFSTCLANAVDKYLPQPSFGERVLEHLPEGWEVEENPDYPYDDEGKRAEYRWSFLPALRRDWLNSFSVADGLDPKAVADALLLLSGEGKA